MRPCAIAKNRATKPVAIMTLIIFTDKGLSRYSTKVLRQLYSDLLDTFAG
ncbi:Ribosome maturation factor RimP (fragment) [Vibrio aestuarianus]